MKRALGNFIGAADTTRFALFTVLSCVALSERAQQRIREEQEQVRGRRCTVLYASSCVNDMT